MRPIDETEYQERLAKIPMEERTFRKAVEVAEDMPTIEVEPVKHGRWEEHPHQYGFVRCSVCRDCNIWGEWADGKKWNYCPNCGAKMD